MRPSRPVGRPTLLVAVLGAAAAHLLAPDASAEQPPPQDAASATTDGDESLAVDESALTEAELHDLCVALDDDDEQTRRLAAARIVAAAPSSVEAIRRRLVRDLRAAPAELLEVMDARTPGRPGRSLPLRRGGGQPDLLEALLSSDRPTDEATRRALREVTEVLALFEALTETGTTEAVAIVVRYGVRERGVFRAAAGRAILRLGDRAIPALIAMGRHPSEDVAAFASEVLSWLERATPGQQVQVRDPAVLAEVLSIQGRQGNRDTIPVILAFTGSEHADVRQAAREAALRYGRAILWPARAKYENFTGEAADRGWSHEELARRLFDAQDRARLAQAEHAMEAALDAARAGNHAEMLRRFELVLGRWPLYDRRGEMVPGLVAYAEELLRRGDRRKAREVLGRAALLETDQSRVDDLRTRLELLDLEDSIARGVADREALDRLLALAPHDETVRRLSRDVDRRASRPSPAFYRSLAAAGLAAFGLACLGLLVLRMTPPGWPAPPGAPVQQTEGSSAPARTGQHQPDPAESE